MISEQPVGDLPTAAQRLEARLRQQAALAQLGLEAIGSVQLGGLLRSSLVRVGEALGVEYGALLSLSGDGSTVATEAVYGWAGKWVGNLGSADPSLQPGFTLQQRAPVQVEDYASESRFSARPFLEQFGIRSSVSVPVLLSSRPWGVLVVHSRQLHFFCEEDVLFLQTVATLIAAAIDRIETQELLAESERRMRVAQRLAHLGSWEGEIDSDRLTWSEEVFHIFGVDPERFSPTFGALLKMAPSEAIEPLRALRDRVLRDGGPAEIEHRYVRPDGSLRHLRQRAELIRDTSGRPQKITGTTLDITEIKRSETALSEMSQRLQTTLENMTDGFLTVDSEWRVTYMNAAAERLLDRSRTELLNRNAWDAFDPALRATLQHRYQHVVDTGTATSFVEYHPSPGIWLDITAYPSAEGVAVYFRDVNERVLREQQLRQQALLLDQAKDAILVRDLDHRVLFWNRAAERLYGWTSDEVLGQSVEPLIYSDDNSQFRAAAAEVLRSGEWSGRLRQRCRDGRVVTVEGHWTLVSEAGRPNAILAINTDITERIDLEERLAQVQKLESIGQLTGGIAHDFNNLLTVIIGNAELLAEAIGNGSQLTPIVELLKTAADRGAELTGRLLAFARRQALEPRVVGAREVIDGMAPLLRRTLGEGIEVELFHDDRLWDVFIDPVQLESALLNLGINARDAMTGGGKLTIDTANVILDETYATVHAEVTPGPYVQVAVTDTGSGMSPQIVARAFDPFFTTKEKGKGTGLGLSMVYGFVKQSGGHVKIYSEPGHGTAIHLYLPRAGDGDARAQAAPALTPEAGGSEHILLVEDDELVRGHATRLLGELGYRVTAVVDGPQALALLEQGQAFDLLFTDVIMPGGISGPQLAAAALRLAPGLPVLYTSGYTENAIVHHGRVDPGTLLLHKPYRRHTLAEKVRQALAPRSTAGREE